MKAANSTNNRLALESLARKINSYGIPASELNKIRMEVIRPDNLPAIKESLMNKFHITWEKALAIKDLMTDFNEVLAACITDIANTRSITKKINNAAKDLENVYYEEDNRYELYFEVITNTFDDLYLPRPYKNEAKRSKQLGHKFIKCKNTPHYIKSKKITRSQMNPVKITGVSRKGKEYVIIDNLCREPERIYSQLYWRIKNNSIEDRLREKDKLRKHLTSFEYYDDEGNECFRMDNAQENNEIMCSGFDESFVTSLEVDCNTIITAILERFKNNPVSGFLIMREMLDREDYKAEKDRLAEEDAWNEENWTEKIRRQLAEEDFTELYKETISEFEKESGVCLTPYRTLTVNKDEFLERFRSKTLKQQKQIIYNRKNTAINALFKIPEISDLAKRYMSPTQKYYALRYITPYKSRRKV